MPSRPVARACTSIGNRRCSWGLLLLSLFVAISGSAQTRPRYVIVLRSFEQQFSPHSVFNAAFRAELTSSSSEPVQFIDVSLPSTATMDVETTLGYLKNTFAMHRPDLIVSVGGVAALFAQRYRDRIFPGTPMLFSSVDQRFVQNASFTPSEAAVAVSIDVRRLVENILHVLPDTETLAVVMGSSQLEPTWRADISRSFERFAGRLRVLWLDDVSFKDIVERSRSLPPHTAILFAHLGVDAHGIPQVGERALRQLAAVANAPIFGLFNSQLGEGIVGGPLLALDELGRDAAEVAIRILGGESPATLTPPPRQLDPPVFDAAQLERWSITDQRLPPGSVIRFSTPTLWQRYRTPVMATLAIGVVETALLAGLLTLYIKRKRAERLRQESEERFRLLADTAPVMIWMVDERGKCTDVNRAWLEFTGHTIEEELGDGWAKGIHEDDAERALRTFRSALQRRDPFRMEYRLRRVDGKYRWILDAGVPRFTQDGSFVGYTGSAIDVTTHRMAKAALSTLSQKLMQAQEEERTRIARELHDDVCQRFAVLSLELDQVAQRLPGKDTAVKRTLAELSRRSDELVGDIQALSHRLHSSKLDLLGLPTAAASFCRDMCEQMGVSIDFAHEGVPRQLPHEVKIGLFRVMQEALANAVKHSGVREFAVALHGDGDLLQLDVVDCGAGFRPQEAYQQHGLGLVSMRERLALIGGQLYVYSRPGEGTTIRACVRTVSPQADVLSAIHSELDSLPGSSSAAL